MSLSENGPHAVAGRRPNQIDALAIAALTLVLLLPAIANGFPLVFPDSGTYLGIAFGREYAIDRSSFYGFFLKPLVALGADSLRPVDRDRRPGRAGRGVPVGGGAGARPERHEERLPWSRGPPR